MKLLFFYLGKGYQSKKHTYYQYPKIASHFKKQNSSLKKNKNVSYTLQNMKRRGYLGHNHEGWYVTHKGYKKIQELKQKQSTTLHQVKIWDKKWRILMFDVPETEKAKREILRSIIKKFGFRECQKSVWICPYPITKEVQELLRSFHLERYCVFLECKDILIGKQLIIKIQKWYKFCDR